RQGRRNWRSSLATCHKVRPHWPRLVVTLPTQDHKADHLPSQLHLLLLHKNAAPLPLAKPLLTGPPPPQPTLPPSHGLPPVLHATAAAGPSSPSPIDTASQLAS
ncbi:hypothetical protein NL676_001831, partial [Syzygium grande]